MQTQEKPSPDQVRDDGAPFYLAMATIYLAGLAVCIMPFVYDFSLWTLYCVAGVGCASLALVVGSFQRRKSSEVAAIFFKSSSLDERQRDIKAKARVAAGLAVLMQTGFLFLPVGFWLTLTDAALTLQRLDFLVASLAIVTAALWTYSLTELVLLRFYSRKG